MLPYIFFSSAELYIFCYTQYSCYSYLYVSQFFLIDNNNIDDALKFLWYPILCINFFNGLIPDNVIGRQIYLDLMR